MSRASRECGCAAQGGNSILYQHSGAKFQRVHSLPTRDPTQSRLAGGMAVRFCLRGHLPQVNREPTLSLSHGISQIVICKLEARPLPKVVPTVVLLRKERHRRGGRTMLRFGTMPAK